MSNEALRRTVRRTGAVVVFAVGTLTTAVSEYARYEGVPLDVPSFVFLLLFFGPLAYLAGSFLVGFAAALARDPAADTAAALDGGGGDDGAEESVAGSE
jgi:hypothetical protein